jgi:acetyltransferase
MGRRSTPEDMSLRFFGAKRSIPEALAARLSQIDYDREIALVAIDPEAAVAGVVRLIGDPDNIQGEFAIMVRSDLKGRGLGHALMRAMLAWASARGLSRVEGDVLAANTTMLEMARELGAVTAPLGNDGVALRARFELSVVRTPH